jgi:hypothetical protein
MNSPSFLLVALLRQGFAGHPSLHRRYGLPPEAAQQRRVVGEVGLEPTKASASGFTVRPLCHSGHSPKMDMRRLVPSACLLQPVMNFVLSFGMAPARAHNRLGTGGGLIPNLGLICQPVNGFLPLSGGAAE